MKCTLAATLLLPFCGCSLVGDAIEISHRRSREVPKGTKLTADRFELTMPHAGLYPKKNFPTKGGITLRSVLPVADGIVYFVTPFSTTHAQTPDQALAEWNARPKRKGLNVRVVEKRTSTFQGRPAIESVVEMQAGRGWQVAAMLVVKRESDFLIICRGDTFYIESHRENIVSKCKDRLDLLAQNTKITKR